MRLVRPVSQCVALPNWDRIAVAKAKRTAAELAELVKAEANQAGIYCFVWICPDAELGWIAIVMAAPSALDHQRRIDVIAEELRTKYELIS